MSDKERLEMIKEKQMQMHALSTFEIDWLIKQAEQNKRYREVIQRSINYFHRNRQGDAYNELHQALEGGENA